MSQSDSQGLRQEILQILIPALLVCVLYVLFFYRAESRKVSRLKKSLVSVKEKAPGFQQIQAAQRMAQKIQKDKRRLTAETAQLKEDQQDLIASFNQSSERATNFSRFHALLEEHGLIIVESKGETTIPQVHYSTRMTRALKLAGKPQFWKLRVLGPYSQMLESLSKLQDSKLPIYVLALDLEETVVPADQSLRSWVLTIWI